MDHAEAQAFAKQWVKDWNAHDVDALLEHFTDDVTFTSPVAIRIFAGDGVLRGKEALRKYWSEGVRLIPNLHINDVNEQNGRILLPCIVATLEDAVIQQIRGGDFQPGENCFAQSGAVSIERQRQFGDSDHELQ